MRLNAGKCKVIDFPASKSEDPPTISIGLQTTMARDLNSNQLFLLKQLRRNGLVPKILANVYKSLVLSKMRYSAVALDSCPQQTKLNSRFSTSKTE